MNWLREPDTEPIPGYRLIEPIGSGGFGEVWKCIAPGGLNKAIKFVFGNLNSMDGDSAKAEQELKALERVKVVRHPFLLSMDRIEIVAGELLIVMELADKSLHDLLLEYQKGGRPGIPREILLGFMSDAAEGLDHLIQKHQLLHLDVKPKNLFLIGERVKVADFGLVKHLERQSISGLLGGITPLYAAPETFTNKISIHSDQYSLAVLYVELLTGSRPFNGKNIRQLALQHMSEAPDLSSIPETDREAVAKALSKNPDDRFPSCQQFVRALGGGSLRDEMATMITPPPLHRGDSISDTPAPKDQPRTPPEIDLNATPGVKTTRPTVARKSAATNDAMTMSVFFRPEEGVLRPAILIGIGSFGRRALQQIRCRLLDRVGELSNVPCFRFLYLDPDPEAASKIACGLSDTALLPEHTFTTPLQPVNAYRRRQLEQVLEWLPREKLYSIPRSLRVDGSRALGRLAFCDHYLRFATRLRQDIQTAIHPESLAQSSDQTGLPVRSKVPSVYILASASGGSSGMLLDVGHAVRRVLAKFNVPNASVTSFIFTGAPEDSGTPSNELANVFATLTELNHYADPDVKFSARYGGPEGPQVDASGLPFNATYLLPMAQRTAEAFRDTISHLAGYVAHDLTTPFGTGLEKIRNATPPFGRTPFRGFGTFGVWYPRGLLLRSAARQMCIRFLLGWSAPRINNFPEDAERLLNNILSDPRLTPLELQQFIAAEAAKDNDGNPVEGMIAWTTSLAAHAVEAGRKADPVGWSNAVWDQTRDWIGIEPTSEGDSPFRRGRLSKALDSGLRRAFEAWVNEFNELIRPLDELSGPRLTVVETVLHQLVGACSEAATALERQFSGLTSHRMKARNEVQASLDACTSVDDVGGISLFGSRSARALRGVADRIKAFADVRIKEDLAAVSIQFYRRLQVWFEEKLRDVALSRDRLTDLAKKMEAHVLTPGSDARSGSDGSQTIAGDEAMQTTLHGSNTFRIVLPYGENHLDQSAGKMLAHLPEEKRTRLELILTRLVVDPRGGLVGICRGSSDLLASLGSPMIEQATAFLADLLPGEDVTEVEAAAAEKNSEELGRRITSYVRGAVPLASGPSGDERTFVMIPDTPAGRAYAEQVKKTVPGTTTVMVRGAGTDLLFCREQGHLRTADLFRLLEPCWEAYHQATSSMETNPHARFDVPGWLPLVE